MRRARYIDGAVQYREMTAEEIAEMERMAAEQAQMKRLLINI